MHETITPWLGHEFVALSAEGDPRGSVTAEMAGLLGRMDERLRTHGLTLSDTVRTRLWARDMDAWGDAVGTRVDWMASASEKRPAARALVAA